MPPLPTPFCANPRCTNHAARGRLVCERCAFVRSAVATLVAVVLAALALVLGFSWP